MLWLDYAFLPFTEKKYMLRLSAKSFKELQGSLSCRQLQHVKKFRQPDMRTLRLLTRKLALSHAEISDMLDMDDFGRPFFIENPALKIAFSYEKNLAVCAFYRSCENPSSLIAIDIENSENASTYHSARIYWFAKWLKKRENQQKILHCLAQRTQKLWLVQECFTKLHGFPAALANMDKLAENLEKPVVQIRCPFPFYARYVLWRSFRICIASTKNLFKKSEAIALENAKFPHRYPFPRIFRFPAENQSAWKSRGTGTNTLQFS